MVIRGYARAGLLGMNKAVNAEEITQYETVEKKYLRIGDMK